jgi:thiamine biosynthesis lipoprotein
LVTVLSAALDLARRTDGAFDPTVQPLWSEGPKALPRVGWQGLEVTGQRIRFSRPGMAVTLNGIAQGYVTDRVADLLRRRGYDHVLVNLGETRALSPRPDGLPWRVAADPTATPQALTEGALATSEPAASAIVDPRTGAAAHSWSRVTVACPTAMVADGLSTALCVLPRDTATLILADQGASWAQFTDAAGARTTWPLS